MKIIVTAVIVMLAGAGAIYFFTKTIDTEATLIWGTAYSSDRVTKDDKNLYIEGEPVTEPSIDVQTFEHIEGTSRTEGYALFRDRNFVYNFVRGNRTKKNPSGELFFAVIEGADPNTIKALYDGFIALDKDHVYVRGELVPGSSPSDFQVVAFYQSGELPPYPGYFLAGDKLYSSNKTLNPTKIDRETFEVIDEENYIFKDRNGTYIAP